MATEKEQLKERQIKRKIKGDLGEILDEPYFSRVMAIISKYL